MQTQRRLVPPADGRDIDGLTVGAADGFPLVVHEGTPGGLVPNGKIGGAAEERGLRVRRTPSTGEGGAADAEVEPPGPGGRAPPPFPEKASAALGSIEGEQIVASLGGLISGAD